MSELYRAMFRRIILNREISFKEKIKRLLTYSFRKRAARILWKKRFKKLLELHPDYNKRCKEEVESAHKLYWRPFSSKVNLVTLRVCKNISGKSYHKLIPEEVFISDIEPTLNQTSSVEYLTCKSFYNHWFHNNVFPLDYFHNIEGDWLDQNLNLISFHEVQSIIKKLIYPVVLKPNKDSYGGNNVYFPKDYDELIGLIENKKNIIVQERIKQHHFFEQFNNKGINTIRTNIYRSVIDGQLHLINAVLRMGVGGSLDNETAGGIVALVKNDGLLNGFAVDKYGEKYLKHPDTGVEFDKRIPDFEGLKKISLDIASKFFFARLICLDLCYDIENRWRIIEVNINEATIRFAQYHGVPFFGEFTDEVYNYCLMNHWCLK